MERKLIVLLSVIIMSFTIVSYWLVLTNAGWKQFFDLVSTGGNLFFPQITKLTFLLHFSPSAASFLSLYANLFSPDMLPWAVPRELATTTTTLTSCTRTNNLRLILNTSLFLSSDKSHLSASILSKVGLIERHRDRAAALFRCCATTSQLLQKPSKLIRDKKDRFNFSWITKKGIG